MNASALQLPPHAMVRLHIRPAMAQPFAVVVAPSGGDPSPEDVLRKGGQQSALLTHDAGVTWPDRRGCALMAAVLDRGGDLLLVFASLADALACRARLEGLGRQ